MNVTVITALLAAIAAIIAPVITSLIDNNYQIKIKIMNKYIDDKIQAFSEFLSAFEKLETEFKSEHFKNKECLDNAKHFYASAAKLAAYTENSDLSNELYLCAEAALRTLCVYGDCLKHFDKCTKMIKNEITQERKTLQSKRRFHRHT